jgi:hypothetical protein
LVVCQRGDIGCWLDIIDTHSLPRVFATDDEAERLAGSTTGPGAVIIRAGTAVFDWCVASSTLIWYVGLSLAVLVT